MPDFKKLCSKFDLGWGYTQTPMGSLNAFTPRPPSLIKGDYF